jgi:hypothetical protein
MSRKDEPKRNSNSRTWKTPGVLHGPRRCGTCARRRGQSTSQLALESKTLNALQVNRRLNSTRNRIMLTPFLEDED